MSQQLPDNELPKADAQPAAYDTQWQNTFNALCHKLYFANPDGHKFLVMIEQKYFYSPVANPGKDIGWAHFNEGRNEFIRSLRDGAQRFMNEQQRPVKAEPVKTKRTRK